MSEQQWFVIIKGQKLGPLTVPELLRLGSVTPDTLAWREGMAEWKPVRKIPELQLLFAEPEPAPDIEQPKEEAAASESQDMALVLSNAEPPLIFWILFLLLIFSYALYQIYTN